MSSLRLPSGMVSFLFTDIEGSTRRWEHDAGVMNEALAQHDALVRSAIESHDGVVFSTGGDGFAAAFSSAAAAVAAAIAAQRTIASNNWGGSDALKVRMAIHTGAAYERNGDYFGPVLNRAARLMSIAHGGQIVITQSTAAFVDGEFALVDLGHHRLKDLLEPEHVWQVVFDTTTFPPLRSLGRRGNRLPVQLTTFVGRARDLDEALGTVRNNRLTTLVGVGGMGKTRLALQVAVELLDDFPDGVWFVDLAATASEAGVADALASTLGVEQGAAESVLSASAAAVSSWNALIVLDNCEHVLDAAAEAATVLLGSSPTLRLLTTSREALNLRGERLLAVGPLSAGIDALDLFVDRVHDHRPDYEFGADELACAADICDRLDGIPLALELAAARARSMTLVEIAARLDARFRLLTRGARGAVSRHQTLQSAIDWSYELLGSSERLVWEVCSVFIGGFALDAAESVCSAAGIDSDEVVDLIDALVVRSVLISEQHDGATRYRMLETIRQYGADRLEQRGALGAAIDAQLAWTLEFVEHYRKGVRGPADRRWMRRLKAEIDNLVSAMERSAAQHRWDEFGRIFASLHLGALFGAMAAGPISRVASRYVDIEQLKADPQNWAPVATWASMDCFHRADYPRGIELARAAFEAAPDRHEAAESLVALYCHQVFTMDIEGCLHTSERMSALVETDGDEYDRADALVVRILALGMAGRADEAEQAGLDGIDLARRVGCENLLMRINHQIAAAAFYNGRETTIDLEEVRDVAADLGLAFFFISATTIDPRMHGDPKRRVEAIGQSLARAADLRHASAIAQSLLGVISTLTAAQQFEVAAELYGFAAPRITNSLPVLDTSRETLEAAAFDAHRARGALLSIDQAIELAERALTEALRSQP